MIRRERRFHMKLSIILAMLQYIFICAYTPGPANFFALQTSSKYGYKQFLKAYPGLVLGSVSLFSLSTLILLFFREYVPQLVIWLHYAGILYILILAWKIFRSGPADISTGNISDSSDSFTMSNQGPTMKTGFLLNITNVKIMILGFTVLQLFVLPYQTSTLVICSMALATAVFITTSTLVWGYLGEILQSYFNKHYKMCNTVMALLLVSCVFA